MTEYEKQKLTFVSKELKSRIGFVVLDCLDKAQRKFGVDRVKSIPEVRYDTTGRSAGLACWNHGKPWININPILLNENVEQMVSQTVPHEVAHIVVFEVYGDDALKKSYGRRRQVKPHGYEWQQVMRVFGLQPDRCHDMDTTSIAKRRKVDIEYIYKCNCQEHHTLSSIRHNRFMAGDRNYHCRECGNRLEYVRTRRLEG